MAEMIKEKLCLKKDGYIYYIKANEKDKNYLDLWTTKAGRRKKA
jgi:hypothetical protein